MTSIADIASLDNLYLAWCKLEKCGGFTEAWYSEVEFKTFRMNLREELKSLSKDLTEDTFRMQPIRPIPYPKGADKEGKPRVRQAFRFSVRDQVAWVAVCNVVGGMTDRKMPGWSYGNRLYLPMWKARKIDIEKGAAPNSWIFGYYRNTKPFLYRKWKQSWPMFRRMITTSLRKMANVDLSDTDKQNIEEGNFMPDAYRPPYIEKDYFKTASLSNNEDNTESPDEGVYKLYWMSIDLTKFYPTIDTQKLKAILIEECGVEESLYGLIDRLFDFEIDYSGYSKDTLEGMGLIDEDGTLLPLGLPTGLAVAGWLANVYFLPIDRLISEKLQENRNIIHFRYVDDHTMIARTPKDLLDWMEMYIRILSANGLKVNEDKMTPLEDSSFDLIRKLTEGSIGDEERVELLTAIEKQCFVDPRYPSPLMTQTLEKISAMTETKLGLMTEREKKTMFHDLQTLIVTDIPEEEIKKETRISFASTMLSRMLEGEDIDHQFIYGIRTSLLRCRKQYEFHMGQETDKDSETYRKSLDAIKIIDKILYDAHPYIPTSFWKSLPLETANHCHDLIAHLKETRDGFLQKAKRIFDLLQKAVRETPDKLNLWIRLLKFTLYNIPERTQIVFKTLEKQMTDKKLHLDSFRYIRSQLKTIAAIALVRSVFSKVNKKQSETLGLTDILELQRIDRIMNLPQHEANSYYERESEMLLMIAQVLKSYILDSDNSRFLKIMESGLSPAWCILWWLSTLKTEECINLNLITLFPNLEFIIEDTDSFGSFLVDWISSQPVGYTKAFLDDLSSRFKRKETPKPEQTLMFEGEEYINVARWISLIKERGSKNKEGAIDIGSGPYESEYIAMKAITGLVEGWSSQMQEKPDDNPLSPLSYYFNLKDIQGGWENITKNLEIKVRIGDESDYDRHYPYPAYVKTRYDKSVFSIGLLLLQLLSLTDDISWILHQPDYGYKWTHLLDSIFSKGKISSSVYRLIEECLSPVTRENNVLRSLLGEAYLDIPFFEGYKIEHINQLNDKVKDISESQLWSSIVCLSHNRHIELTVIDLK